MPRVGGNFQPGLGRQLSSRVSSGAITKERANKTASERKLLEDKFGKNWRERIYGGRNILKNNRKALAEGSTDPNVQAFNERLMALRANAVKRAKESEPLKPGVALGPLRKPEMTKAQLTKARFKKKTKAIPMSRGPRSYLSSNQKVY